MGAELLTKILDIEGVGLLHRTKGGAGLSLKKATMLYAENGRGKSTLSSLLTSCATRDSSLVEDRVTIGGAAQPAATLMFGSAKSEYKDRAWSGFTPEILVYDGNFVSRNVHTGNEVTSDQRASLLSFALGSSAVDARRQEEEATRLERAANEKLKSCRHELEVLVGGRMAVPQFRALAVDPDVDAKMLAADRKLAAVSRAAEIKRQAVPERYPLPDLDIAGIFQVLASTLENVHARAAARVSEHLSHLGDADSVQWIQRGMEIARDEECPFCGQGTSSVELIEMYRIYFDQAYVELQEAFEVASEKVLSQTDVGQLERIEALRAKNNEAIGAWSEQVPLALLEGGSDGLARASLANLQDLLGSLLAQKASAITEAVGGEAERSEAERLWQQVVAGFNDENEVVQGHLDAIAAFKQSLDATNVADARSEVGRLAVVKLRASEEADRALDALSSAEADLREAEVAKKAARERLNSVMRSTLAEFRDSINEHLRKFNADFEIAEFSHNYRGSAPRMEYQLRLRGEAIKLTGGRPTFATALSEGDKKTMGFAFFAASTLADPDLDKKIVVIDDPMSSLDTPRREHTARVIEQIAVRAQQVIVMAHDENFLRQTRDRIRLAGGPAETTTVTLRMSNGGYSDLFATDLDELCQSDYLKNYRLVSDVVSGKTNDPDGVAHGAVALRPLLEGYLHRKYPGVIPSGGTLGKAITAIEDSAGTDAPCSPMAAHVAELREMNEYASKFHHETEPDYAAAKRVDQREVVQNGQRVLAFVHSA